MDKNYRALELDKILEMLAQETTCADAAEKAALIAPVHTATQAQQLLEAVSYTHLTLPTKRIV